MPALQRIVLINTHMKGIVELKLDGHTNICGTNASGKTTLQRLIPVFYGEYPSRVVPATRDSFERWYLPTEASYIIYEYIREHGELCQLVLSSGGQGVDYRLLSKGFDIEDYAKASLTDERHIISPKELSREIKKQGVICTRILNTKEYKAIVQNDRAILSTNRDLPGLARMFSLCEQSENLRHIEKLAKAVHSKEGKMETIKAMVAAILEEDGVQPGETKVSANKVEEWLKEVKLVKGFDDIRPEFVRLEQANIQYQQNNQRLAQLKQQFNFDLSKVAQHIVENQSQLEETILTIKQLDNQWLELRDQLNQTLSEGKADQAKLESELDKVEQDFDDWQDKDIEKLKENLEQLPRWKSELESSEARYVLVTEKHQDIEATYHKRKSELQEQHKDELEGYNEQKDQLREDLVKQQGEQNHQILNTEIRYKEQIAQTKAEYTEQAHQLENRITLVQTLVNNQGFSQDEQNQIDIYEHAIKEASSLEDITRERVHQASQELAELKQQRESANKELEQNRKLQLEQQAKVEKVEALLYPGQSTLLEFLRREVPQWQQSVGKFIHPELLSRTDLHPAKSEQTSNSVFGVELDLETVDLPEYAESEHDLQAKLEQAQHALAEVVEAQNDIEGRLAELNKLVRESELAHAKYTTELNNAVLTRKRAQQDKDDCAKEFHQALQQRKQEHQKQLSQLQSEKQNLQMLQAQAVEELQEQQREAEMDLRSHWELVISELNQQITNVETHIGKCKAGFKSELDKLDSWLKDELANRGVDVDEIGQLKRRLNQLKEDIKETEKNRHLVTEYKHWYQTYYLGHKVNWQSQLAEVRTLVSDKTRELEKQKQSFKQNTDVAKNKQSRFESALKEANEQEHELQTINKQLAKLKLPTANVVEEAGNIAQRINEGQSLLIDRENKALEIKDYVEHFDQKIAAQSGTGFYDTWERSRQECSYTNEQGVRQLDHIRLVSHLDRLVNDLIPQQINAIREQGRIFGLALSEYYKLLKDIEGHIGSQSKRISKEVDEELFLDGVSDSAVKIRSKVAELEFWPELQEFNKLYNEWIAEGAHELPGDEYAYSMRRVMDILGRSALTGGISKLLDIELHIKEGNSDLVIRTDRQLNESSSHGMAYLILCKFLLAFTRLLRGKSEAVIHWPIDELGTLHQSNIKKIFDACQNNNIHVVGAFPNPESEVLTLFDNRYLIDKQKKQLQVVQPKVSVIGEALKRRKAEQAEAV